jgi:cellulose synthase/poly-beta-1,6-N-acetylglucosamine synthase-like glycosyltransferase
MQNRWRWLVGAVVALAVVAEYAGFSAWLGARITALASQPGVSGAFQHPDSGRTDALTALIAFAVLTPIAAFLAVVALVLIAKAFETLVVSVRLPAWLSTPVVGVAAILVVYVTSQAWLPPSLYGLGLIARAYLVYAYGAVPLIR